MRSMRIVIGLLLACCICWGLTLQSALAQDEGDLETQLNQVVAQSQNQVETAQIALEEAQAAKERLADQLATLAEDDPNRETLEAALQEAETQVAQAGAAFEQVQSSHNQVMTLADQAGSAASETETEAVLAAAEAASATGNVYALSVQTSLEAVVTFETGDLETGQTLAQQAESLEQSGVESQGALQGTLADLDQGNYDQVIESSQTIVTAGNQAADTAGQTVAGGPAGGEGGDEGGDEAGDEGEGPDDVAAGPPDDGLGGEADQGEDVPDTDNLTNPEDASPAA